METFDQQLKNARIALGLNRIKAAEFLGISYSSYEKWERGHYGKGGVHLLAQEAALARFEKALEDKNQQKDYFIEE